jgi:hypothetical protein
MSGASWSDWQTKFGAMIARVLRRPRLSDVAAADSPEDDDPEHPYIGVDDE